MSEGWLTGVDARTGTARAFGSTVHAAPDCAGCLYKPYDLETSLTLNGARPATLTGGPSWLAIPVYTDASETDLGCAPWGLFCSEPIDERLLPDLG